jgi:hypothetical protein
LKTRISLIINRALESYWLPISLAWCLWVLFPLLDTGFISDDAYNSQVQGRLIVDGITLWDRISSESLGWLKGSGRFNPVNWIYIYGLYYLTTNTLLVKILTFGFIWVSIILFSQIINILSNEKNIRLIIIIILPTVIQFRLWHDPVVGFSAIIPIVATLSFASILLYERCIRTCSYINLIFSILLYIFAVLTYELSYFIFPLFILIYISREKNTKIATIGLFFLACVVGGHFLGTRIFMGEVSSYPSLIPRIDPAIFFNAFFYQVLSGFPLSWRLASNVAHSRVFPLVGYQTYLFILISALLSYIFYMWDKRVKNIVYIILFSLSLIFFSALPAALSGHQEEIFKVGIGFGYIVVYMQYFGVALLIALVIKTILNFFPNKNYYRAIVSIFIALIIGFSGLLIRNENSFVVKQLEWPYKIPRNFLSSAMENGIFDDLKADDLLIRNYMVPSDNSWFLSQVISRRVNACSFNVEQDYLPCIKDYFKKHKARDVFALYYGFPEGGAPFAIFAKIHYKNELEDFQSSNLIFYDYIIFQNNQLIRHHSDVALNFANILNLPMNLPKNFNFDIKNYDIFYKYPINYQNFWGADGNGTSVLRWSSGNSKIVINNPTQKKAEVKLIFRIVRPDNEKITVDLFGSGRLLKNIAVENAIEVLIPVTLESGKNEFILKSIADPIANGDPRNIVFGLVNFSISEGNNK